MLPTNINKECPQISFKSLAIFIRLSDIAYQNITFIKKNIIYFFTSKDIVFLASGEIKCRQIKHSSVKILQNMCRRILKNLPLI